MKKIGLYFGTFNPIHIGHMVIANHMVEFSDLDEVWFIVTPQSPFKTKKNLLDNHHRYQMVFEATKEFPKLKPSKIEFNLPQPNYTINFISGKTMRPSSKTMNFSSTLEFLKVP